MSPHEKILRHAGFHALEWRGTQKGGAELLINLCIMGNFLSQSSISIELLMEVDDPGALLLASCILGSPPPPSPFFFYLPETSFAAFSPSIHLLSPRRPPPHRAGWANPPGERCVSPLWIFAGRAGRWRYGPGHALPRAWSDHRRRCPAWT